MLQLQRASAGSGKTFTLAKKFIWFLITVKDEATGRFRLRTEPEIADGISRILAITFTNKATAEMKQRIIDRLASLAGTEHRLPDDSSLAKTDYLIEFAEVLEVDHRMVGRACRMALSAILNQYSDFNVSTIDSFFQTVLRTFAYESNLNDSYQVEIDSEYIATAAVDATLDEVNSSGNPLSISSFWLRLLMNDYSAEKGSIWNVFQKNTSDDTIYSKLRNSLKKMENEEFKEKRDSLDDYLDTDHGAARLIDAYRSIRSGLEDELRKTCAEMKRHAAGFSDMISRNGLDPKTDCIRYVDSHLTKIAAYRFNDHDRKKWFKPIDLSNGKSILKKGVTCPDEPLMTSAATAMYEAYSRWTGLFESEKMKLWKIYSATLPYLGLLLEARTKIAGFLDSNNLIQLGETNSMLSKIIGDSDTPFIYERLGTSINHYLIDEFQDTSKMQWDNLRRLLTESDSRGEDSLIIGDAKQSIYRFRNADPTLITTVVPENFAGSVFICGMSKEDNTNWRSDRFIVEFNNFFFRTLADEISVLQRDTLKLGGISAPDGHECIDFLNLYGNVVQYPRHQDERGYVEIRFFKKPADNGCDTGDSDSISSRDEESDSVQDVALREIGPLISSLLERGYAQREIALLVDTKKLGNDVIKALIDYNSGLPEGMDKIEFISEDSLLISSSEAVGIIISALERIAEGYGDSGDTTSGKEGDDEGKSRKIKWNNIRCDFTFFALRHPELPPSLQVAEFLRETDRTDSLGIMLAGMQAVTLPSLVESIVENFVPETMRKTQAVFIAGLQDLVLDYCERHTSDIASFLDWWRSRGVNMSISSPEDTDAVQVMTIHKSKGLEFKCVILPFEAKGITPYHKKREWRWVAPSELFAGHDLPQWIPVETTKDLLGTEYADIYLRYNDMYMMDRLNSLYVAFTRAKCELYVFTKHIDADNRRANKSSSAWLLRQICSSPADYIPSGTPYLIDPKLMEWDEDQTTVTFGVKTDPDTEGEALRKKMRQDGDRSMSEELVVDEYGVNSCPSILHCLEEEPLTDESDPAAGILESELEDSATVAPEAADADPRSEGNLLHAIMQRVRHAGDLRPAIMHMKMRGIITAAQADEWEPMLRDAISSDYARDWFAGSWRILNEREIIHPGGRNRRPDRIMISPDHKEALIIDYKFGEAPGSESDPRLRRYLRQVEDYADSMRRATGIGSVKTFVWFVRQGKVFPSG